MRTLLISLCFFLVLLPSCKSFFSAPDSTQRPQTVSKSDSAVSETFCSSSNGSHLYFSVEVDGKDVGREVRSLVLNDDLNEPSMRVLSHTTMHMKMGSVKFETRTVRTENSIPASGRLISTSHVSMDQITVRRAFVEADGLQWFRKTDASSAVTSPLSSQPTPINLRGDEIIGYRLIDYLSKIATGSIHPQSQVPYYEALLNNPVLLETSSPDPGTISFNGIETAGFWIEARRHSKEREVALRAFFDRKGNILIEEYPSLHQVRRRIPGPLTQPPDSSELLVGLYSDSYISDPNSATRAVYRLRSTPSRLEGLELLSQPSNQTLSKRSDSELILEVHSGSPDGSDPPVPADTASSKYISTDSLQIKNALLFLKTAGRKGYLPPERRINATEAIAKSSLIRHPKFFWSDPDKVAPLLMDYVSSILPDKRHTFSMADAVTTLNQGSGDCTEHSVLFASLMRAHGIPTRLVSGMQLLRGGVWGYHMWNSYWNGYKWQAIDTATLSSKPGALHVALGRGSSRFSEVRDRLADFIWRTFAGISFDLIEAVGNGEYLVLARPRNHINTSHETLLFSVFVLSERGNYETAIKLLDDNIQADGRSLSIKLMRIELIIKSGAFVKALEQIESLRRETSSLRNTHLLDEYELECLLEQGLFDRAEVLYNRISKRYSKDSPSLALVTSKWLFGIGQHEAAIKVVDDALSTNPRHPALLSSFARFIAKSDSKKLDSWLPHALKAGRLAVSTTFAADEHALTSLVFALLKNEQRIEASWILDHVLILSPDDPVLLDLRQEISTVDCSS